MLAHFYGLNADRRGDDIGKFVPKRAVLPKETWRSVLETIEMTENEVGAYHYHENEATRAQWISAVSI